MTIRQFTSREKTITLAGVLMIGACAYGVLRLKPAHRALVKLEVETVRLQAKIRSVRIPKQPPREADQLLEMVDRVRAVVAGQQVHVDSLESRFVDQDNTQALADHKLELSSLADRHGVKILEAMPRDPGSFDKEDALYQALVLGDPYERPVERWVVEASFNGLHGFIEGLNQLRWRTIILEADINIKVTPGYARGPQTLITTFVLAL